MVPSFIGILKKKKHSTDLGIFSCMCWRYTTKGLRPDLPKQGTWVTGSDQRRAAKDEEETTWAKAVGRKPRFGICQLRRAKTLSEGRKGEDDEAKASASRHGFCQSTEPRRQEAQRAATHLGDFDK